jgi:glycine/D-amino acid oxidase-like deaminating enzyme
MKLSFDSARLFLAAAFTAGLLVNAAPAGAVTPNKPGGIQWRAWSDAVSPRIRSALATAGMAPIAYPVNCRAIFYRDANRGDAVGYYQGLADVLEKAGVVINDVCITTWDGSRLRKDAANPRVEVELTKAEE